MGLFTFTYSGLVEIIPLKIILKERKVWEMVGWTSFQKAPKFS